MKERTLPLNGSSQAKESDLEVDWIRLGAERARYRQGSRSTSGLRLERNDAQSLCILAIES